MARPKETMAKRGKEKKRLQKRMQKEQKREERKAKAEMGETDDMIAWVDEDGNIVDTPPEEKSKPSDEKDDSDKNL